MGHESAVWFAKSFGLFYLVAMSVGVVLYAYWPSNRKSFDTAAQSILEQLDRPGLDPSGHDQPYEDSRWR